MSSYLALSGHGEELVSIFHLQEPLIKLLLTRLFFRLNNSTSFNLCTQDLFSIPLIILVGLSLDCLQSVLSCNFKKLFSLRKSETFSDFWMNSVWILVVVSSEYTVLSWGDFSFQHLQLPSLEWVTFRQSKPSNFSNVFCFYCLSLFTI